MNRDLLTRVLIAVGVTLVCIFGVIGLPASIDDVYENIGERIRLGLDLKGGTHLILQVQVQDAIRSEADQAISRLRSDLGAESIGYQNIERNDPQSIEEADNIEITISGLDASRAADVRRILDEGYTEWRYTSSDTSTWHLRPTPTALARIKNDTVIQAIATIENRINGLGLTEPTIQQHGRADAEFEILVQLPGVSDPARVMQILQMSAVLETQEVRDGPFPSPQAARAAHSGMLPPNSEILPYTRPNPGGPPTTEYYVLARTPIWTGRDLRDASAFRDTQTQIWATSFSLSRDAAQRFRQFTRANIGRRLAVVLDNRIKNVAEIRNEIGDQGQIEGLSSQTEATDLALVLRAGSLPASVVPLEERTVGASLGADSIRQGIRSALLGLGIVLVCMVIYYRRAGINANIALFLNLIILLAVLGYFGFTLTLPGIAGIILTIGMAVDANVLIFERIREELRAGKGVVGALNAGFSKAFVTILDSNLTTIIAAAFLFLFGTGPVRGFAVTLAVGLMANMFTAVFVSRLIFDLGLSRQQQVKELSI